MKGRVIKKLKSISTISSLSLQGLVFRTSTHSDLPYFQTPLVSSKELQKDDQLEQGDCSNKAPESIFKDDEEQEGLQGPEPSHCVKEDVKLASLDSAGIEGKLGGFQGDNVVETPTSDEIRFPSGSKKTGYPVEDGKSADPPQPLNMKIEEGLPEDVAYVDLLQQFEEKCPPGGNESVVLYTTSMRGIRKTFEGCNSIRFLLESFRVEYNERDVSLHLEYRDELWKVMGNRAVPPRLFIRGRYIGGADEVVGLHERGMLKKLLQGIPRTPNSCSSCKGCAGVRFVLCFTCNGSRKIVIEGESCDDELVSRCPDCNENGLVKCPICNSINK